MNPASPRAVVDASVAVKIFVPESLSGQAQEIFAWFASTQDAELVVPDFFFIECASVFRKWVQRAGYPAAEARQHMADLVSLGLTAIPAEILSTDALQIALRHGVSAYDACYVAAAAHLELPLISADRKLCLAMATSRFELQWLGDT